MVAWKCCQLDKAFGMPPLDSYENIIGTIDVVKKREEPVLHPFDLVYNTNRIGTKGIYDDFEVIVAAAAAVLSQNYCGDFLVRQHLKWNQHVRRLEW
jgi:hypothetical protein